MIEPIASACQNLLDRRAVSGSIFSMFLGSSLMAAKRETAACFSRRDLLRLGGLTAIGSAWPLAQPSLAALGSAGKHGKARSCILIYLLGGPPHQDMWDLKPEAPAEVRGPFKPIATNVPGI
jgi:hypothetical protein